ncbi:MAG: ADP-heptose--LPS heptosyltransferase II [bacterium]|nr:MAG: ADP-heptose--LPS heptosyltransferase II [bacterium]
MTTDAGNDVSRRNILVLRTDRIGDVVLSTPVFSSIRKARPRWNISVLVRPMIAELLENHPDIDEIITLDTNDKPSFFNCAQRLHKKLRPENFDFAVHLYSDFWVSMAVWRAGIPLRIGPASKAAQIFYNRSIKQRRSKGFLHEADYSLALLKPLGIEAVRKSSIAVLENPAEKAASLLDSGKKNVGVFPGMGGSARNWQPSRYAGLSDNISANGVNVILVCGPGEKRLIENVESISSKKPALYVAGGLKELAAFIKSLDCFVAPSTGPLHIASAVGTPAVGIYCPIRVCLPSRWGPIGENDSALKPDVPVCESCTGRQCEYYDCMDSLDVETVANAVMERT